jgi:hypothetical protein
VKAATIGIRKLVDYFVRLKDHQQWPRFGPPNGWWKESPPWPEFRWWRSPPSGSSLPPAWAHAVVTGAVGP